MLVVGDADGADELPLRIANQAQGIGVERNVGTVLLGVPSDAIAQFAPLFGRIGADPQNLDVFGSESWGFVYEGRNLRPTPWSPATAVEEHNRDGRTREHGGEVHRCAINILERRGGERVADRKGHHNFLRFPSCLLGE
jgi:hypothetical protein